MLWEKKFSSPISHVSFEVDDELKRYPSRNAENLLTDTMYIGMTSQGHPYAIKFDQVESLLPMPLSTWLTLMNEPTDRSQDLKASIASVNDHSSAPCLNSNDLKCLLGFHLMEKFFW